MKRKAPQGRPMRAPEGTDTPPETTEHPGYNHLVGGGGFSVAGYSRYSTSRPDTETPNHEHNPGGKGRTR